MTVNLYTSLTQMVNEMSKQSFISFYLILISFVKLTFGYFPAFKPDGQLLFVSISNLSAYFLSFSCFEIFYFVNLWVGDFYLLYNKLLF